MDALQRAAEAVVGTCLRVAAGEEVVVVADRGTRDVGAALREAAAAAGGEAVLLTMEPRDLDGQEPPRVVAAALSGADVFLAPTSRSLSHTAARKAATDAGARGATLPGVTPDLLARLMGADLALLRRRSRALAQLLAIEDEAHFTCPRGSDLRLDLTGRSGIPDDGDLTAEGAFGNLPCGEGFVSPLSGEGRFVAATVAGMGRAEAELVIEDGRLVAGTGAGEALLATLRDAGEQGTNLAELGVGTNERATLTGNVLEDEKILGTVHVAFGASMGIGGTVAVPVHLDCVVLEPTLDVGTTRVIEAGRFVFGEPD
jgi:aminopeptidase